MYILYNDLHEAPFGYMEDVYVAKEYRGQGFGKILINKVIRAAREHGCYKLVATSRRGKPKVHKLYRELGFDQYGYEFRLDF